MTQANLTAATDAEMSVSPRKLSSGKSVVSLRILAALGILYTAYFAADILVPFVVAIMLALALAPMVRILEKIGVPAWLGAGMLLVGGLSLAVTGVIVLSTPAAEWVAEAPLKIRALEPKLLAFSKPIQSVKEAGKDVENLTSLNSDTDDITVVKVMPPDLFDVVLSGTPKFIAAMLAVLFFLYFLLASGQRVTMKLTRLLDYRVPREHLESLAQTIQSEMSHYLLTVACINLSLGIATATMLWSYQVPDPILWGAVVALLNFAPYIGAVTSTVMLAAVALVEFGNVAQALLVAGSFMLLTILEGQLITPVILGRRLALSPYVVFVGIIFFGWLWGIAGALMAVPLMVCAKIICEQIPETQWLAVLVQREQPNTQLPGLRRPKPSHSKSG